MTQDEYLRYVAAFNARDYATLETFFADDFVLENAGFKVTGKQAFREFYAFFHEFFREEVIFKEFFPGKDGFVANVVIRFTGLKELSPEVLDARGFGGMTPIPMGASVDVEFFIHYRQRADGLIHHIKGAVWVPAGQ